MADQSLNAMEDFPGSYSSLNLTFVSGRIGAENFILFIEETPLSTPKYLHAKREITSN